MSGACSKPSVRRRCAGRERRQRISPLDAVLVEIARTAAPEHDGAELAGADEQPADVRVLAEGGDQLRMP